MKTLFLFLAFLVTTLSGAEPPKAPLAPPAVSGPQDSKMLVVPQASQVNVLKLQVIALRYEVMFKDFQNSQAVKTLLEENQRTLDAIYAEAGQPKDFKFDMGTLKFVPTTPSVK